jgi:hypothetical protein
VKRTTPRRSTSVYFSIDTYPHYKEFYCRTLTLRLRLILR